MYKSALRDSAKQLYPEQNYDVVSIDTSHRMDDSFLRGRPFESDFVVGGDVVKRAMSEQVASSPL